MPHPDNLILSVVGARPQFVKAAPVSRTLANGLYCDKSYNGISGYSEPKPLQPKQLQPLYGSAPHGAQTGRMLEALEGVIETHRPGVVVVYGDTNSTLAGALAAAKLHVPVAHVEAGLRSFNRRMPEEVNRVLTDHVSTILFAPTDAAVRNLAAEGITKGVVRTGDVMYDAVCLYRERFAHRETEVQERYGQEKGRYALVTVHRAENTDDPVRWQGILEGIRGVTRSGLRVLWPVHPRVRDRFRMTSDNGLTVTEPLPYLDLQALLMGARVVLTDSGGLQKEAAFHHVPCVTLRDDTEWVELVEAGVNILAGADSRVIAEKATRNSWPDGGLPDDLYGNGHTADKIVNKMQETYDITKGLI